MTTETSTRPTPRARRQRGGAWAKHLLVFLHVLTSLGWWAMGLAQLSFMVVALGRRATADWPRWRRPSTSTTPC
ncbi:MAG: hypothetical protein LC799_11275 [Actinobacteria bacterium]|nr:hypothetical protein [Actinomycetota bacterium]